MVANSARVKANNNRGIAVICALILWCYTRFVTGLSGIIPIKGIFPAAAMPRLEQRAENWLDSERDQIGLWLPVGLGVGIALWQSFGTDTWPAITLLSVAFMLFAMLAKPLSRVRSILRMAALLIALGFAVIALKSAWIAQPVLGKIWIGEFYGRVEAVENISARDVFRLRLATDGQAGLPPFVRVNLTPEQYQTEFQPGAVVKLRARLMPPAGPALPGGYDFARRAWFQQIGATGSALGEVELNRPATSEAAFAAKRQQLTQHILKATPEGAGPVAAALVTGDQGHISEEDAQAMRDSGMAHLLSISGLHVTAVVGFIFLAVSRLLSLSTWLALRISIPIVAAAAAALGAIAYTLLAGAEVPTVRSCIAAILILAALAMGREALTLRLVAFGATIVLLAWPESMAGPSFQLSFAAVATIVIVHELPVVRRLTERREEPGIRRVGRAIFSLIITGIAIELVLAPIALFHFHKTGLYGAMANVLAIPLTTFWIMPMEAVALFFDLLGWGAPFWWLAGQGIFAILALAHSVSALPGAVTMMPAMPDWAFAALISGALLFGLLKTKMRFAGAGIFIAGLAAMIAAPRPDILVTGDGKHLAIVDQNGEIAFLRAKAGDFVADMLLEKAGTTAEVTPIENWPGVRCTSDICILTINSNARQWRILATRTPYQVPSLEMAAACSRVDIVISDRWLPKSCAPQWIKADRNMLQDTGGLAFYLANNKVTSVHQNSAHTPWVQAARAARESSFTQ
jgi:competence protein ComEC